MSDSSDRPPTEPESHEMTPSGPGQVNDNNIKSDTPYLGQKKPGSSSSSNTAAMKEQNRLSDQARGEESEHNISPEKRQAAASTGQPERPVNVPTVGDENNGLNSSPKTQEDGGRPLESKRDAGNAADTKKDTKENSQPNIDKTNGWVTVYDEYRKLDEDWAEQTDKYIDTLLVFAGLFSAVLTAFLVQVYTELQPDNVKHSAQILLDLSNQLHSLSLSQEAFPSNVSLTSVEQPESLVATTSLWFVSLILSLGAALFGILVKQWIREYMRWTTVFPLQHAIHVRYYRRHDLDNWHVDWIISVISECLEVGLVLFFAGLAVLLWRINGTTAHITTAFVGLVLLAATIATALPALILRCPYRTSFGSFLRKFVVLLRRILRRILFPIQAVISSAKSAFMLVEDRPWDWRYGEPVKMSRIRTFFSEFSDAELLDISEDDSSTWPLLFTSWINSDSMLRLPHDFQQSTIDRFTSLHWLTTHRAVPDDLVGQCLSDLPGTPVALPKREWDDGWKDDSAKKRQRQGFTVGCCALLSLLRSEKEWEERKEIVDFEKLLVATLPDRTQDMDEASLPPAYKNIDAYSLSNAVRRANEQSRNMLSTYFLSLTKGLLGSQQLLSQDTDFDLLMNLLRTLFSLWYFSDYQYAQIGGNIGSIDVKTDPAAQAFDCLRELYGKLLAQSEQMTSQESQARFTSIIGLLRYYNGFGWERRSFLYALARTNPSDHLSDINPTVLMKASQCYLERNREESSLVDAGPLDDKRRSKIQRLTQVFWDIVAPIFGWDVQIHPNIPTEDCKAFLAAVETVLKVDITADSQYVYYRDWQFRYLPAYVLRHLSYLPDGFVSTLRKADEGRVIDIGGMLSKFDYIELPEDLHAIRDKSAFWSALEPIQPETNPTPEPESPN